jgi:Hypothetical glycosyl hydrolase family 15
MLQAFRVSWGEDRMIVSSMHPRSRLFLKAAALVAAIAALGCQAQSDGQTAHGHYKPARVTKNAGALPKNVPAHVQTAEYLWTPTERDTDPSVYAPYLTWAYPLYSKAQAVHNAGIKTVFYINPIMPQVGEYEYKQLQGQYASVLAKDCSGNPVSTYQGRGILADPRAQQAGAFYNDIVNWYIKDKIRDRAWDAFFIDNNGALYGAYPLPCNYNAASWGAAFDRAIESVGQPMITNSLATKESETQTFVNRLSAKNIIGGMFEECFNNKLWTAEEQSQIQTLALLRREHKAPGPGWWCYLNNTSAPGATSIPKRLFGYASFLLTYDPNYSLFQESFTTQPSTFKVYPETGFVPLGPAKVPSNIADLQTDGGAYVQMYRWCYMRKKLIGACEIAVNPGNGNADVPNPQHFGHSMVLSGGGVLDGGSVSFTAPPVSSLGPQSAAILVP